MGEIWAFIVGWTVPLEYMIGNAAVARSWSAYFDNLVSKSVSNWTLDTVGRLSDVRAIFESDMLIRVSTYREKDFLHCTLTF